MKFYQELEDLSKVCQDYQKKVDEQQLWYTEPYQTTYLKINELLKLYETERLAIEEAAAGEMDVPVGVNLTEARAEFYELSKEVPKFLASEHHYYYYLQTYYIACVKLLKLFSYSQFPGDFQKMYTLKEWLGFINKSQDKHDASGSMEKSFDALKKLGDFDKLDKKGLQELQHEVHNIQTLLQENPDLEEKLSQEDAELLKNASQFVKDNDQIFDTLPELEEEEFVLDEPPAIETVVYRCKQLVVQADDFPDKFPDNQEVTHLSEFLNNLEACFDMSIDLCADIYNAVVKEIGSYKNPSIKRLCKMLHHAFVSFTKESKLQKKYNEENYSGYDVEIGLPDTIQLYDLLVLAIDEQAQYKNAKDIIEIQSISASVGVKGKNTKEDVLIIQQLLNDNGYPVDIDGLVGPQTINEIKKFQQDNFGWEDGRVDPDGKTWYALS